MVTETSYEIISLKDGKWETDGIVANKGEAIERAQESLGRKFFSAVKVIEERFNDQTGESKHFIVFNKKKTLGRKKSQYTGPERRKGREWRDDPKAYLKKVKKKRKEKKCKDKDKRKNTFANEIIRLIMILGGILISLILLIFFYVSYFRGTI